MKAKLVLLSFFVTLGLFSSLSSYARKPAIEPAMEIAVDFPTNVPKDVPPEQAKGFNFEQTKGQTTMATTKHPLSTEAPNLLIIIFLAVPFISWFFLASQVSTKQTAKSHTLPSNMVNLDDYRTEGKVDTKEDQEEIKKAS